LIDTVLTLRLIKVVLASGTVEILATSLTDPQAFPAAEFGEPYHARWNIEEEFKLLKHRLHVEHKPASCPKPFAKILTANEAKQS